MSTVGRENIARWQSVAASVTPDRARTMYYRPPTHERARDDDNDVAAGLASQVETYKTCVCSSTISTIRPPSSARMLMGDGEKFLLILEGSIVAI